MASRTEQLLQLGQSVWMDFIRRGHLASGEFDRLVKEHGIVGVTSNPTIFREAIAESDDYDSGIERLVGRGLAGGALFDALAVEDIQSACDRLLPIFERSKGMDGRVSIEVNPHLAGDSLGTIAEARRLHGLVGRVNLHVKVPATPAGLPAITALIAEGICINVTLIFSLARYEEVMDAYLRGLEERAKQQLALASIHSVASFFVSRVDSKVDRAIDQRIGSLKPGAAGRGELEAVRGKAAVANARLAYQRFKRIFASDRFRALQAKGAHPQRPLWASTSTKDPKYRDVVYVEELIGPQTVNTMPLATIDAFNDHGVVEARLERDLDAARDLFKRLPELGVPVEKLIGELEQEGVDKFAQSYDALLDALKSKRSAIQGTR
ncbi:MAG: transaldolase [Candidatus Eisenbacteria bacterium RBG_16_71_46]|nr:MAG: transaldolase [Candidatus Eisenbacteria bacterium RBG_16_71_46]